MKLLKSTYQRVLIGASFLICTLSFSSCCSETEDCACAMTPAFKVYTTKYSPAGSKIFIYLQDTATGAIQDSLFIGKSFSLELDTAGKNIFVYTVNENERLFKDRNPRAYRMIFSHKDLNVSDTLQHLNWDSKSYKMTCSSCLFSKTETNCIQMTDVRFTYKGATHFPAATKFQLW